jgi:hypothetical protein
MMDRPEEYEPILAKSFAGSSSTTSSQRRVPSYGGFSQQKRVWAAAARRARRLRCLASAQLSLGVVALFNYLWCVSGCSGVSAAESIRPDAPSVNVCVQDHEQLHGGRRRRRAHGRALRQDELGVDRTSVCVPEILVTRRTRLTLALAQYLILCAMEFARIVLLLPRVYERYLVPDYAFTGYEYFQVAVLVVEEAALIVRVVAVGNERQSGR